MHAERDHLVKVVFPELRERLAKLNLYLVDVDLRWGVTEEEAEHGKVLQVCLDEVDRCRPFFIGILGERYGSVVDKTSEDTESTCLWLAEYEGHSLTALEIMYGVLRNPDMAQRSFFYFRDSRFLSQVPENRRADYMAESSEAACKLAALKDQIHASGRPVMEDYPCNWDDSIGCIVGLDAFGQRVLEDLYAAICAAYPAETQEADPLIIERQMHEAFAEERSRLCVGRVEHFNMLTRYVQGSDRRPIVITGESGCGKSAFLASWYRKHTTDHPNDFVLAYFIGASPDSTNHFRLLRQMCSELKRHFALREEIPQQDNKLPETLAVMIMSATHEKPQLGTIVVVLDALDQLQPLEAARSLSWLLDYMPERTRLVASTLEGDCLDVLRRRGVEEIALPPLTYNEQKQIIQNLLGEWRRKLDAEQMAALLAHPGAANPLYLRVALEELRLFGKFEELNTRIRNLSSDLPELFGQVLARLEEDHGRELVSKTFTMISCSRFGLSETELLQLLRREGEEQFPRALWARFYRSVKMYLAQRGELIGYFHQQLAEAVSARYPEHKSAHARLSAYFGNAPLERKLDEYPYQLQYAEEWKGLAIALSDPEFFGYAWNRDREYEWVGYWQSLSGRFEPASCYQAAIDMRGMAEGETEYIAALSSTVGKFLSDMGLYTAALPFDIRAVSIMEHIFDHDRPQLATSLNILASLYRDQGKYDEALPPYKRAIATYERTLGYNHPYVAHSLNDLAILYYHQGKYNEAVPLYQRALSIMEQAFGSESIEVAESLNNMALIYQCQGRYAEALSLCERALSIYERNLGPNHPTLATGLNNIAFIYNYLGKYKEAVPLHQRALSIRERALGPDHPDVAQSLNNLAMVYYNQGKYADAKTLQQLSLDMRERTFGLDHPLVAQSLNSLALLCDSEGKYEEALPLYKRALSIWEHAVGPFHNDVAICLSNLAQHYHSQQGYEEALPLYQQALSVTEKALGSDHSDVATRLNNLALLYWDEGKYDEAISQEERALAIHERTLGSDHPTVAATIFNLAGMYCHQGKYYKVIPLYQRVLAIWEPVFGPDHPKTLECLNNLATVYYMQGKYSEAIKLYQRIVKIAEEIFGVDHESTNEYRDNLRTCQESLNSDGKQ